MKRKLELILSHLDELEELASSAAPSLVQWTRTLKGLANDMIPHVAPFDALAEAELKAKEDAAEAAALAEFEKAKGKKNGDKGKKGEDKKTDPPAATAPPAEDGQTAGEGQTAEAGKEINDAVSNRN